jgi:hypothetical protein
MALDFPTNPALNEIYTYGGRSWQWNGTAWDVYNASSGLTQYVSKLNGLCGSINIAAGTSISVTPTGNTLTIAYTGGGGGGGTYFDFIQGTTATTGPTAGDRWYDTGTGKLLTAVTDGASNIWVEFGGAGPQGNTGNTGATGPQGNTGATGATGSQGIQGNTGATGANGVAGNYVVSLGGLTGAIGLSAGSNVTLTPVGNTITIASAGSPIYGVTASIDFSANINGIEIVIYGTGGDYSTSLQNLENNASVSVSITTFTLQFSCTVESIKSFYDATNGWSARLICKPLFTDITTSTGNYTAEQVIALGFSAINLSIVTVLGAVPTEDYWTTFETPILYHQEETYVTKTLTGITWVTENMFLNCKVLGLTSADHTPEDAILEGVRFEINNILGGTGFDIIGHASEGTYGKYTIKCLGQ